MPLIKEVQFFDGEALDFNDLNNSERYLRSQVFDSVLGSMSWGANWEHSVYPETTWVYALRGAGMAYYYGSAGVSMATNPGLVAIAVVNGVSATGDDVNLIGAFHAGQQYAFAANSTIPVRWDILQARVLNVSDGAETRDFKDATTGVLSSVSFNKKRTPTLTVSVKAGTVDGVEPTPDAGYIKLAAIRLNTGYAGGTARPNDVRDYRMPMGATSTRVTGRNWAITSGTWATSAELITAPATAAEARASAVVGGHHRRLMKIGLARNKIAGSTAAVSLREVNQSSTLSSAVLTLTASLMSATGFAYEEYSLTSDVPIWANGKPGRDVLLGNVTASDGLDSTLVLNYVADGVRQDQLLWARFFFAGGM